MTTRRLWASLLGFVGFTVALLAVNLGLGNRPVLGLDLQGGVSVVLAPTEGASDGDLLVIRDLVRDELESRGIAEPDVRVEGANIVVDLPGVKDQREALDAVDVAGIVTLRPVFGCVPGAARTAPPRRPFPGRPCPRRRPRRPTTPATPAGFGNPAGEARPLAVATDLRAADLRHRRPPSRRPPSVPATDGARTPGPRCPGPPCPPCHRNRPKCCARSTAAPASSGRPAARVRSSPATAPTSSSTSSAAGPSSSASPATARWPGTTSPPSASTASRPARATSWPSCSTTSCSRTRP